MKVCVCGIGCDGRDSGDRGMGTAVDFVEILVG